MSTRDQSTLTATLVGDDQAAEILGIKRQTLAVWRSTGRYDLPFIKVGRSVRYRLSDLEAFMESRTFRSTGEMEAAQ